MSPQPVLVVGVPRSGTSWVGRVLAGTPGTVVVNEPDNHGHSPFALRAKLALGGGFFPAPVGSRMREYDRLWREALGGEVDRVYGERVRRRAAGRLLATATAGELRRALGAPPRPSLRLRAAAALAVPERPPEPARRLIVKSVHAPLALEWIAEHFDVRVLVIRRAPLNVVSSWKAMGWLDGGDPLAELHPSAARSLEHRLGIPPPTGGSPLERGARLVGLLASALEHSLARHPEWLVVSHEELSSEGARRFAELAAALGLEWSDDAARLLAHLDRPGSGYETTRVAAGLEGAWRMRLTEVEATEASGVLRLFDESWAA